ncbi:MAG: DUF4258 domain-containing protein [Rhodospirillaceae bacterium]
MTITFTTHALTVILERGLSPDQVKRVLASPDWLEPDATQSDVTLAFGRLLEKGGRVLRVAYVEQDGSRRVLTAFLDRTRRHGPKGSGP